MLVASVLMTAGCPYERTWDEEGSPRFIDEPINPPDEITIFVYPTHFKEVLPPETSRDLTPEVRSTVVYFDGEQRYMGTKQEEFFNEDYGWMESVIFPVDTPAEEIEVLLEVLHIGRRYEMRAVYHQDEDGNWVGEFDEAVRVQ